MKKTESVYREILYRAIEKKEKSLTQYELSKRLNLSLSIVNSVVKRLESMGAVKIMKMGFDVVDVKKILYYWASLRNLSKDIEYKKRIETPVREIERIMPDVVFTAYTAYKLKFKDVPADYSEVYLYAADDEIEEIKKRVGRIEAMKKSEKNPNLFVLKKDPALSIYEKIPAAQIFVDLWNLGTWYAKDFLNAMEEKLGV